MINNLKKNSRPLSRRAFNTLLGSMGLAAVSSTNSYPKFDVLVKYTAFLFFKTVFILSSRFFF